MVTNIDGSRIRWICAVLLFKCKRRCSDLEGGFRYESTSLCIVKLSFRRQPLGNQQSTVRRVFFYGDEFTWNHTPTIAFSNSNHLYLLFVLEEFGLQLTFEESTCLCRSAESFPDARKINVSFNRPLIRSTRDIQCNSPLPE